MISMIIHKPLMDAQKVIDHYTEKDNVPIKYVCSSSITESGTAAADIFYRDTPHPEFGNRYFGLYWSTATGKLMIANADKIEDFEFGLVEDENGNLHYSRHRWDYLSFSNGNMIDGGRSYIKSSGSNPYLYRIKNGEMVENG